MSSIPTTESIVLPAPKDRSAMLASDPVHPGLETFTRVRDYAALVKPRIALLSLLTVAVGYLLASPATLQGLPPALLGAALLAAGAGALNQLMERHADAQMGRTAGRPLPAGRIRPTAALCFGVALVSGGALYLVVAANALTALVGLMIVASYLVLYTPLKRCTTLNTAVGAVSGALPPVMGWAAARGEIGTGAWGLFLIVFVWQFPHFLAIAWLYRDDYARAGMKMLPVVDATGAMTGLQALAYALILVPVSLLPTMLGLAGHWYFWGACGLGVWFLVSAARFCAHRGRARLLLHASLVYLPLLFGLMLADRTPESPPRAMLPVASSGAEQIAARELLTDNGIRNRRVGSAARR